MEITLENADRSRTLEVSESGQVSIGRDLAGKKVRVAVEIVDGDDDE